MTLIRSFLKLTRLELQTFLVDNDGHEVRQWSMPYRNGRHARILPNGNLSINSLDPDAPRPFWFMNKYGGGIMSELDPVTGEVVRQHKDPLGHHDAHHYGDGTNRILYTSLERLDTQMSAAVQGGLKDTEAPDGSVYADVIREVDDKNNITFEWRASQHLDRDTFPLQPHFPREHWPLINSVFPLEDGNILCSLRSVSAVLIISRQDGQILWHLDSNVVAQQHCASELENGNILLFDNGAFRHDQSFQFSRTLEVDRATKQIVWSWNDGAKERFYSPFMGSVQRLPPFHSGAARGNTLVCESAFGRILEIDDENNVCWEYVSPYLQEYEDAVVRDIFPTESNALFRAYKYTPDQLPWLHHHKGGWLAGLRKFL